MKTLQLKIKGVRPLLLHNGALASPLNDYAKRLGALTHKRKKTEADYMEIARLEWLGGMYPQGGLPHIVLPGKMIRKVLILGARKDKLGKQLEVGLIPPDDVTLLHEGGDDPNALWDSGEYLSLETVKVGQNTTVRSRPLFKSWGAALDLQFLDDIIEEGQMRQAAARAGREVGMGDWRPLFGLFEVA